jgi:hypothetical protein
MNQKQIKSELIKQKVEACWLENNSGTVVYPKNAIGTQIGPHLDKMFATFNGGGMPNGIYSVCAKIKYGAKSEPLKYQVTKGAMPALSEEPVLQDRNTGMPMQNHSPAFSPMEFIQLNADLAACKAENTIYKQQIARLEAELYASNERCEELQDKLDDREPQEKSNEKGFAEQASTFLSAAAPFAPLLAAFFAKGAMPADPMPAMPAMPAMPVMPGTPVLSEQHESKPNNEKNIDSNNPRDIDDIGRIKMLFQSNPEAFDRFVAENYELGQSDESDESDEYEYAGFDDNGPEIITKQ